MNAKNNYRCVLLKAVSPELCVFLTQWVFGYCYVVLERSVEKAVFVILQDIVKS